MSLETAAASDQADLTARVLEGAHEAYVAIGADGRISAWNAAAAAAFGWSAAEAIGRPLAETIIPEHRRDAHLAGLERYLATGVGRVLGHRLELEAIDREGRQFPIEMTISVLHGDDGPTFHAFLHDITDRRLAAGAQRMAAIIDCSADAIAAFDEIGTVTDWNPAAERLFGYSREEMLGHPTTDLVPDDLHGQCEELWRELQTGDGRVCRETRRIRRDGTIVDVELTLSRLAEPDGHFGCSATYRDITERIRAERELAERSARLKARTAAERLQDPTPPSATRGRPDAPGLARELVERQLERLARLTGAHVRWDEDDGSPPRPTDLGEHAVVRSDGAGHGVLRITARSRPAPEALQLQIIAELLQEVREQQHRASSDWRSQAEMAGVDALLAALDARDQYTGEHSHAVVELSLAVARSLGLDEAEIGAVGQVASLHDLGKVGVPDSILQKPGPLTAAEWEVMREHPAIGARIVAAIGPLASVAAAVRAEHERWDGGGYPDGLAGESIPVAARITFACDAYHAMISDRPYRRGIGQAAAERELAENAGSQFDPAVVRALLGLLRA